MCIALIYRVHYKFLLRKRVFKNIIRTHNFVEQKSHFAKKYKRQELAPQPSKIKIIYIIEFITYKPNRYSRVILK